MRSPIDRRRHVLALVALALLIMPSLAAADPVLVVVGGETDPPTLRLLSVAVSDRLQSERHAPQAHAFTPAEVDALIRCVSSETSKDCAKDALDAAQTSRAVVMRVARESRDTTVFMAWMLARGGETLATKRRVCERCSSKLLAQSAAALLSALLREVDVRTTRTGIAVKTTPGGARVSIDGEVVGVTELERGVLPGRHRIVMELRGYETATRELDVLAGETAVIVATLRPLAPAAGAAPPPAKHRAGSSALRLAPWIAIGAGSTAAVAGIALIAANEPRVSDGSHRYKWRDSKGIGVAVSVAGVAVALAGGAGLWWLRRGGDEQPSQTPTVSIEDDGVVLGYAGRF
jgi:hypothetical protein